MIGIEVSRNGERLYVAALEDGLLTAKLTIRNQIDPIWFDVAGRDCRSGGHVEWSHLAATVGDEFALKLVEIESPPSRDP